MNLWQQLVYCAKEIPRFVLNGTDGWLMDVHRDRGDGKCLVQRRDDWPCREYIEAVERIAERGA